MKKFLAAAAALAALAGSMVVGAGPASSADSGPMAYTIIANQTGCDLATLDLTTGELTDLPAATSPTACVEDLAVSPEGLVMGINQTFIELEGFAPAAPVQSDLNFVSFDADGTPFASPIFIDDIADGASLEVGGISVGPAGIYFQAYLGASNTSCDAGIALCLLTYDPETGVATPIGGSGQEDVSMWMLTYCASGMYTLELEDGGYGLDAVSTSTGAVTDGPSVSSTVTGMDCAVGSSPLYAIAGAQQALPGAVPAAILASVGTLDPATGLFTPTAAVSDPEADLYLLAVVPQATPTTTTTAPAPAVAADTVTPAFTG